MTPIQRIRQAVRDGKYFFTDHAIEEAQADDLLFEEVVDVLLNGDIDLTYTDDPRGTRYVVRDDIADVEVDVVCRFLADEETLLILTVYIVD